MRELTMNEMEQVDGGFGVPGAIISGAYSGITSIANGDSIGQVAMNVGYGMATGFFAGGAIATGVRLGVRVASGITGAATTLVQGELNSRWDRIS